MIDTENVEGIKNTVETEVETADTPVSVTVTTPKKRGRPKKVSTDAVATETEVENLAVANGEGVASETVATPKKRGRPRKKVVTEGTAETDATANEAVNNEGIVNTVSFDSEFEYPIPDVSVSLQTENKGNITYEGRDEKVAIIGDLHFYDSNVKSHKDYFQNAIDRMEDYTKEFMQTKPTCIVIAGDLIGLNERIMRTRFGLYKLAEYLQKWNVLTNNNVYVVEGNHDKTKADSVIDYQLLQTFGCIKHTRYIDLNGLRIHCVDYGDEHRVLDINPNKHNIAVVHANMQIDGITTWFRAGDGVQLGTLRNFKGIEVVFAGHIHDPSPRVVTTSIEDESVNLLYLGCAMRPKRRDKWNAVHIAYADCLANGEVNVSINTMKLPHWNTIFTEESMQTAGDIPDDITEEIPVVDIALLTEILDNLKPAMIGGEESYREQIKRLAGADKVAAELAIHYIDIADERAKETEKRG